MKEKILEALNRAKAKLGSLRDSVLGSQSPATAPRAKTGP
jgi:hypothetical protein